VIDASGGDAFVLPSGQRRSNIVFKDLAIHGTIRCAGEGEGNTFKDLIFGDADSSAASGRGLFVESSNFYNVDIENIGGYGNDGATLWTNDLGQSEARHVWSYASGSADGTQIHVQASTSHLTKFYASEETTVSGIELEDCFNVRLTDAFVEQNNVGIRVRGGTNVEVVGGRSAPLIDGGSGEAVRFEVSSQTGNRGEGHRIRGIQLQAGSASDELVFTSDTAYCRIGHVRGGAQDKIWNSDRVTLTDNGFQNTIVPFWHTVASGGFPQDTTQLDPLGCMLELDDGTGRSDGNVGLRVYDPSSGGFIDV
jgi:hypothetical protein